MKIRKQFGMVFQSFELFPHMTAVQNVSLALKLLQKKSKKIAKSEALDLLNRVGLADRTGYYLSQLEEGIIVEQTPVDDFFKSPASDRARLFLTQII